MNIINVTFLFLKNFYDNPILLIYFVTFQSIKKTHQNKENN